MNNEPRLHELKIWPGYFDQVASGAKTFVIRLNDRDYKVGDTLLFKEWNPDILQYTGREVTLEVTHIMYSHLLWCGMSIAPKPRKEMTGLNPVTARRSARLN